MFKHKIHQHQKIQTTEPCVKNNISFVVFVLLNLLLVAFAISSLIKTPFSTYMFLKFTNISVLFSGICAFIFLILSILLKVKKIKTIHNNWKIFSFCVLIAIAVTMFGYWIGIIFTATTSSHSSDLVNLSAYDNLIKHLILPLVFIGNFLAFNYNLHLQKKQVFFILIFPFAWLITQIIVYYTTGYYPYFCLNYGSRVGWFGFNFDMSDPSQSIYIIGSFYWILAACGIIIGIGFLLRIVNMCIQKSILNHQSRNQKPHFKKA